MLHSTPEQARELFRKIRKMRLQTHKLATDLMAGEYQSAFKGQGMEFDQVREFVVGDEPRQIDWNVTARFGKPFVKSFVEERSLTLLFMADTSASLLFGTEDNDKRGGLAEIAAALALNAAQKSDRVGLLLFGEEVEQYLPPKKGNKQALRILRTWLAQPHQGRGDPRKALAHANRVVKGRAVIFLMSDFLDLDFQSPLQIPTHRHDFVAIEVVDPLEEEPFNLGLIELKDLETGHRQWVDTDHLGWQQSYRAQRQAWRSELTAFFKKYRIDHLQLTLGYPFADPLRRFLRQRRGR